MAKKIAPVTSRAPEGPHEKGLSMTLQQFLTLTATSPAPALRSAIAVALSVETPSPGNAYGRFYCRVIAELGIVPGADGDRSSEPAGGQLMVAQRLLGIVPHLTREREERSAHAERETAEA